MDNEMNINEPHHTKLNVKLIEDLVHYFHEINVLKFRKRKGWEEINILGDACETISAHCFRTAIIAYHLALVKGIEKDEAAKIAFFAMMHDMDEVKLNDITPRQSQYIKADKRKAIKDALMNDEFILEGIKKYSDIIKDADSLDMLLQAKEYMDIGNRYAYDWILTAKKNLKLKESIVIAELAESIDSKKWVVKK
ncbi:MAG: HD domain-containing protein [Candidatus Micrarchaeota archaeon]|nr:HD domain-containing protein [Candidatus Micrarchaeota archaeon]